MPGPRCELDALEASGSLRTNTVLVHGLAITPQQWHRAVRRGVSLVWCPASNLFLFGRTLCMPCRADVADGTQPVSRSEPIRDSPARSTCSTNCALPVRRASRAEDLLRMVTTGCG